MLETISLLFGLRPNEKQLVFFLVIWINQILAGLYIILEPGNEVCNYLILVWSFMGIAETYMFNKGLDMFYNYTVYAFGVVTSITALGYTALTYEAQITGKVFGGILLFDVFFTPLLMFVRTRAGESNTKYDSFFKNIVPLTEAERIVVYFGICIVVRLTIATFTYKHAGSELLGYFYSTVGILALSVSIYLSFRQTQPWWYNRAGQIYRYGVCVAIATAGIISLTPPNNYSGEKAHIFIAILLMIDAVKGMTMFVGIKYDIIISNTILEKFVYFVVSALVLSFALSVPLHYESFGTVTSRPTVSPTLSPTPPTSQPTISPTQSPIVPCTTMTTTPVAYGSNYYTLASHNVECPAGYLINGFGLRSDGINQLHHYEYICCSDQTGGYSSQFEYTYSITPQENGDGNYFFLDRLGPACSADALMRRFQLVLHSSTLNKYTVTCPNPNVASTRIKEYSCTARETAKTDGATGPEYIFLDRQFVLCNTGEYLQRFQLHKDYTTSPVGNYYSYTCCSYVYY